MLSLSLILIILDLINGTNGLYLTQGMMNSPTMCQYYVAKALEPVRKQFPNFLAIHCMDDILLLAPSILETQYMFDIALLCLKNSGLIIAPERIQTSTPYH